MNFGNLGILAPVVALLLWCLPLILAVWFIKTLAGMASSLRDIVTRLQALERAVRDATASRPGT